MRAMARAGVVLICLLAVIGLGIAGLIIGEADDSPGLQAIGVGLIVISVVVALRRPTSPRSRRCRRSLRRTGPPAPNA